jgi:Flp pilus assembly protein TadD
MAVAAIACMVLAALAWGTWQRNRVWRTEESLWYDITLRRPANPDGLIGYGVTQLAKGNAGRALDYFEQALVFRPADAELEVDLATANDRLHRDAAAEEHYARALGLAPDRAEIRYAYAVWLLQAKRNLSEAVAQLNQATALNPAYLNAWHLLLRCLAEASDREGVRRNAEVVLALFPADEEARAWLRKADTLKPTPELYASRSAAAFQERRFDEAVEAARAAIALRPDYAPAWNNLAIAENARGQRDEAIRAEQEAVRLQPDFETAKKNLAKLRAQR